ncbi:MAG: 16S rRNA (cytosine(1402)-N(4))-methyltransferase RsmH [Minisyncoccia bacterium]
MHLPVLLKETIDLLNPQPYSFIIDGTVDGGGHLREIIQRMDGRGKILAVDWDKNLLQKTRQKIEDENLLLGKNIQILWLNDNFKNLPVVIRNLKIGLTDGLLLDLGMSNEQLNESGRGFSFLKDEPLLMTYSDDEKPVYQWLRELSYDKLTKIIKEFGEEKYAAKIAKAIKAAKKIKTSKQLADVVSNVIKKRGRIHPATRTFQALRIFANHELENLESILDNIDLIVKPNGRVVILTFHSLEDRIVKNKFKELIKQNKAILLTKKIITPSFKEIKNNPNSRSAKLRAIQLYDYN